MIVVRGTKDRQQKVQAAAFASGTMQQVRHERPSSGQPKLVAGSSGAMEEIQLSRATPPSLPWIDGRRFRNNSEEDRDDAIVIRDRHRHSYVCSRAAEMPPSQPSWSTRYPRDEATSWHGSYFGQASEPRPRVVSSNWSYQRPVQGQVEQSHPWDWKAAPRTQPSHVTMKASSGSTAEWSSWSKPVQDAPKPPQAVTDGALMTNLANAAAKRQLDEVAPSLFKKSKGLDKLDLLCQATLEIGPLQENPTGCSCPKSKCIALYCDCFKAGRRCDPQTAVVSIASTRSPRVASMEPVARPFAASWLGTLVLLSTRELVRPRSALHRVRWPATAFALDASNSTARASSRASRAIPRSVLVSAATIPTTMTLASANWPSN